MLAAVVIEVAARGFGERMDEQPALGAAGDTTTRRTASKFFLDSSSVHSRALWTSGCRRSGVPEP